MLEHVHNHITSELQQNTKTDIIFILSAIVLNLIILAVNAGFATDTDDKESSLVIMFLFVALLILLNLVVIFGLLKGKQTMCESNVYLKKDTHENRGYLMGVIAGKNIEPVTISKIPLKLPWGL